MLRNGLYNFGGQAIRGGIALLSIPLLIHFLGIREYGVWSLAYAVLALMSVGEAGISIAAVVHVSRDLAEGDNNEASWTLTFVLASGVLISVAMGLILWFTGSAMVRPLSAFANSDRLEAGRALQIAGFAVAVLILQRVLVGIEQAFDRYKTINALDVAQSLLTNIGFVLVAWQGGRTTAMMKWQVFAWSFLLIAHCYVVFRLLKGRKLGLKWNSAKAKRIFRFSTATWASTFGSAAFSQCDRLVVGGILGAPILGVYSAITNITSRINSISGMAVQPLLPSLSRDAAANLPAEKRVQEAAHLSTLIAVEAGIFLFVLADWVMRIMAPGANIRQQILSLQVAAIIYTIYSCSAPGYFILFSVGEARKNAVVVLSSSVLSLAFILVGARYFGLLGAVSGNVGYLGTLLMVSLGVRKFGIALRRYLSWVAVPLLALTAAFFVGLTLQQHFWWRVAFVAVQAGLLTMWFSHEQNGLVRLRGAWGRVAHG